MASDSQSQLDLEVQYAIDDIGSAAQRVVPTRQEFHRWVMAALSPVEQVLEMVIRVVDEEESRQLNERYRGKNRPTNVLSFPFAKPAGVASKHLGDLVICAPVVKREAREQRKQEADHWAHMVVHGVLHLRGWDHETEEQAREMEALEKRILAGLEIDDPYQFEDVPT